MALFLLFSFQTNLEKGINPQINPYMQVLKYVQPLLNLNAPSSAMRFTKNHLHLRGSSRQSNQLEKGLHPTK